MDLYDAKGIIESFQHEKLENVVVDDWNSESMDVLFQAKSYLSKKEKMALNTAIKRFFKNAFGFKVYSIRFDQEYNGYWIDFPYSCYEYNLDETKFEDTLVFSKKAYQDDEEFANIVLETATQATSKEHHMELIKKRLPQNYIVEPLWTYSHTGIRIDRFQRCQWDSAADAFCAYKNEEQLEQKLEQINECLMEGY